MLLKKIDSFASLIGKFVYLETLSGRIGSVFFSKDPAVYTVYIIHLLDRGEPYIRFVVQIDADVGRSEAESIISLDLNNKSNIRRGSVQQMFYYAETTNDNIKN